MSKLTEKLAEKKDLHENVVSSQLHQNEGVLRARPLASGVHTWVSKVEKFRIDPGEMEMVTNSATINE